MFNIIYGIEYIFYIFLCEVVWDLIVGFSDELLLDTLPFHGMPWPHRRIDLVYSV